MPETTKSFVKRHLQAYSDLNGTIDYQILVSSDEDGSYASQFVERYEKTLKEKKTDGGGKTIYLAFREKANNAHWSAAILQIHKRKPKLFIFDSTLRAMSQSAINTLTDLMRKYGGVSYLCLSGLQYDDNSCRLFTLDFLLETAKLSKQHSIFSYLLMVKQTMPKRTKNKVTRIQITDLPWRLVRNAQRLKDLDAWFSANGDNRDLKDYLRRNSVTKTIQTGRGQKEVAVNDGIFKTFR